ncbi:MAG TPA: deoxyribodipyrimidine photo-lyase, partial [Niastella sp.]
MFEKLIKSQSIKPINIFWFRRDLRLHDNAGLYHALKGNNPVLPVFIFDTNILDQLPEKADRRVTFIHAALTQLQQQLNETGASLQVFHGTPLQAFEQLTKQYQIEQVFTNHDYEPYARERDDQINDYLQQQGIAFSTYKDQVIFEKNEVVKDNGSPYTVFTPYSKRWKATLQDFNLKAYSTEKHFSNFYKQKPLQLPSLASLGFKSTDGSFPSSAIDNTIIKQYEKYRDYPA